MRPAPAVLAALVVALPLTACAAELDREPDVPLATELRGAAPDADPEVVTTPAPGPVPAVGAIITTPAEVAAAEAAGLGVYVTGTGTNVVIDPAAPAPQVMLDEIRATGNAVAAPTAAEQRAQAEALLAVGDRALASGKRMVFIVATGRYGDFDDSDLKEPFFGVMTNAVEIRGRGSNAPSREEAIAIAEARIDGQPDPSRYEIVVLAG